MVSRFALDGYRKSGYHSSMNADVRHRIRRLFGLLLVLFVVLVGWQSYLQLFRADWLLAQKGNRRVMRAEVNTPRGVIFDRNGTRLAWSVDGQRAYADAMGTAAVLGYLDPVYGRTGVEGEWDAELAGVARTFDAREFNRITHGEKRVGNDLVLTLDLRLQQAARAALGDRRGAIAVLDPATGGILALATSPTFDPRIIRRQFSVLNAHDDGALRNRAAQDLYPPGSAMKVLTATAALMHGVDAETRFTCTGTSRLLGVNIKDYHGAVHGELAMTEALVKSCNNYFARAADAIGPNGFAETARAFGFGTRWWTSLPERRILPLSVALSTLTPAEKPITKSELLHMGFGQSTVVATPLQMAMVAAGVANGGKVMAPYLVAAMRKGGTEQVLSDYASVPVGFPMNGSTADSVSEMMRGVVTRGTGTGANVRGMTVYGKTGTAEQEGGSDHAWFIGFARREHAGETVQIAFAVVLERGGTGGMVAVPAARQVLEAWGRDE